MHDSAKKCKIFLSYVKHFLILPGVRNCKT